MYSVATGKFTQDKLNLRLLSQHRLLIHFFRTNLKFYLTKVLLAVVNRE